MHDSISRLVAAGLLVAVIATAPVTPAHANETSHEAILQRSLQLSTYGWVAMGTGLACGSATLAMLLSSRGDLAPAFALTGITFFITAAVAAADAGRIVRRLRGDGPSFPRILHAWELFAGGIVLFVASVVVSVAEVAQSVVYGGPAPAIGSALACLSMLCSTASVAMLNSEAAMDRAQHGVLADGRASRRHRSGAVVVPWASGTGGGLLFTGRW